MAQKFQKDDVEIPKVLTVQLKVYDEKLKKILDINKYSQINGRKAWIIYADPDGQEVRRENLDSAGRISRLITSGYSSEDIVNQHFYDVALSYFREKTGENFEERDAEGKLISILKE